MKKFIAGLIGAGLILGAAPAFAGEWRVDTRRCSVQTLDRYDGRDGRYDDRYDNGRGDRSDSRYDNRGRSERGDSRYDNRGRGERGDRRYDNRGRGERITVCSRSAFYYVPDRRERYSKRYRTPRLSFTYDSRLRLSYRFDGGRKIYVRA